MQGIDIPQWIVAGIAFAFSASLFVSAIWFPHWRAEWGGRGKPGIPMSVRGKIAMGVSLGFFGIAVLIGNTTVLLVGMVLLMIAISPVLRKDRRDSENL
jgi:hypothetical protein